MTPYGQFQSLKDYLTIRCEAHDISFRDLSAALGYSSAYITHIANQRFKPSRDVCDQIAYYFDDNPHLVRVLAGLENPAPTPDDAWSELRTIFVSLSKTQQELLMGIARLLKGK